MSARKNEWTDEEIRQLAALVAAGGSPARAAVKFKRRIDVCRQQARLIGTPFEPLYIRRRRQAEKCAAAEMTLARG